MRDTILSSRQFI